MADNEGTIIAVCTSLQKGERKTQVPDALCTENYGIEGDAHAGPGERQVSFLAVTDIRQMQSFGFDAQPGDFAENVVVDGSVLFGIQPGDTLEVTDGPEFVVTCIGKLCHNADCTVKKATGTCIMPTSGVFTRVAKSGMLRPGQHIRRTVPP